MSLVEEAITRFAAIPGIAVRRDCPLSAHARFGIGGPADIFVETGEPEKFIAALHIARTSGLEIVVIGGGTNLIVADEGFRGVILKLSSEQIRAEGAAVYVESGALLQTLVDFTIDRGLEGLETMTGIPGSTGAAIYGNAGAYGRSIAESVSIVRFFDGESMQSFGRDECRFRYRESVFKEQKDWIVFSADLALKQGDAAALRATADRILAIRNKKYPPTMKCAGSIFKNFLLADLPANVVREIPPNVIIEGKVPSAWFLEQVGAKGMQAGDIHVADYHANLIYNTGHGTARDLVSIIAELKHRVAERWRIPIEEEVQYVGLPNGFSENNLAPRLLTER